MPGVRISHPTEKDCLFTLVDGKRPYTSPNVCLVCSKTHLFKTYHFRLDTVGAAIVSREIVARLKQLPDNGGFTISNEVRKPPAQTIGLGGQITRIAISEHPTLKEPI